MGGLSNRLPASFITFKRGKFPLSSVNPTIVDNLPIKQFLRAQFSRLPNPQISDRRWTQKNNVFIMENRAREIEDTCQRRDRVALCHYGGDLVNQYRY